MSTDSQRLAHKQMVLRMADRQGLDLEEMSLRAEMTEEQFETAVDRCVGCTQPTACKCLLDGSGPRLALPDFCRNGDFFADLQAK